MVSHQSNALAGGVLGEKEIWKGAVREALKARASLDLKAKMKRKVTLTLYREILKYSPCGGDTLSTYLSLSKSYGRLLLMRARSGTLVLKADLFKWQYSPDDKCVFCGRDPERLEHLMVTCQDAELVAARRNRIESLERDLRSIEGLPSDAAAMFTKVERGDCLRRLRVLCGGGTRKSRECLMSMTKTVAHATELVIARANAALLQQIMWLRISKLHTSDDMHSNSPSANTTGAKGRKPMVPRQ